MRTHIPIGGVVCLMLEPGTRVSHAACALAGRVGTLLAWIGEAGVGRATRVAPGRIACCFKPNWRWMTTCGSISCAR